MTPVFSGLLLALFGLSLILITLSLRLLRGSVSADEAFPAGARFFLIALRLAIGWHCFVEGMEKIHTPHWSSEVYLRESIGPLSRVFRQIPGDRLLDRVAVIDDTFPPELERDWRIYATAFTSHYRLTDEQNQRVQGILDQRKKDSLKSFSQAQVVTKITPFPPELKVEMTMKQRLEEHQRFVDRVNAAEAKFPTEDKDVHADWKNAKADLGRWRGELKKAADAETLKLKSALEEVPTSEQKQTAGPLEVKGMPIASWRLLEVSDFLVKWSLIVLGACLLLGVLSRLSCFATALLLFSFYAAMPALPGWPESPRLEGHYMLVNKTLIEVIALLALAFLPTGRWAGLDGLLCLCCCGKAKPPANPQ